MSDGAVRRNFNRAACSEGRSLPASVRVLPAPWIFARELRPRSAMIASMRLLYSAAALLRTGSGFLIAAFSIRGWEGSVAAATVPVVLGCESDGCAPDSGESAGVGSRLAALRSYNA